MKSQDSVKSPFSSRLFRSKPSVAGPYSREPKKGPIRKNFNISKPDQTENEHAGFGDLDRVFDDYDNGNIKPGMPYTDRFGSVECVYCRKPMIINDKGDLSCSHCRRQLSVSQPQQHFNYDPMRETGEGASNEPSPHEAQFDTTQYPKLPGEGF